MAKDWESHSCPLDGNIKWTVMEAGRHGKDYMPSSLSADLCLKSACELSLAFIQSLVWFLYCHISFNWLPEPLNTKLNYIISSSIITAMTRVCKYFWFNPAFIFKNISHKMKQEFFGKLLCFIFKFVLWHERRSLQDNNGD